MKVNLPPLTGKDLADIRLGVELGVDYVALSFCREAADIEALKRVLGELGSKARTVAKIEDQHAVKVVDEIIEKADVVMVDVDLVSHSTVEATKSLCKSLTYRGFKVVAGVGFEPTIRRLPDYEPLRDERFQ